MTSAQLVNNLIWMTATGLALVSEGVLFQWWPLRLARLAFVPLKPTRRIPLGPRLRALMTRPALAARYRDPGLGPPELRALAEMVPERLADRVVALDATRGLAAVRLRFGWRWLSFGGMMRIRFRVEGDDLCLAARAYPSLSLTATGFFGGLTLIALRTNAPFMVALFAGIWAPLMIIASARTRLDAGPHAAEAMDAIAERMRSLEADNERSEAPLN